MQNDVHLGRCTVASSIEDQIILLHPPKRSFETRIMFWSTSCRSSSSQDDPTWRTTIIFFRYFPDASDTPMCMATSRPDIKAGEELLISYEHEKYDPFTFFSRHGTAFWPQEHRKRRAGNLCRGTELKTFVGETNVGGMILSIVTNGRTL